MIYSLDLDCISVKGGIFIKNICGSIGAVLLDNLSFNGHNSDVIDDETKNILETMFSKLSVLKNLRDEEDCSHYCLYYLTKPNIDDYISYEYLEADGDVSNYEEYLELFKRDYSDEFYWFEIDLYRSVYLDEFFYSIFVNGRKVFSLTTRGDGYRHNYSMYVDKFNTIIDDILGFINQGIYYDTVVKNLPYEYRRGIISIKDLYRIYPDVKEDYLSKLSGYDINEVIKLLKISEDKNRITKIKELNSGMYLGLLYDCYKAIGNKVDGLTPKEAFLKYADDRHQGLLDINPDSYTEFDYWYEEHRRHFDHTFEVLRGRSFYRGHFYIGKKEDGYYFAFSGNNFHTSMDLTVFYLTLYHKGYIAEFFPLDIVVSRLTEASYIAVVSCNEIPYGYIDVFDKTYIDSMDLPEENRDEFIKSIIWEDIEIS